MPPSVKHRQHARLCPTPFWHRHHCFQTLPSRPKQNVIHDFRMVRTQQIQFIRKRKNHMIIFYGNQFLSSFDEPFFLLHGRTNWTVSVGTRGKNHVFTSTIPTLNSQSAECLSATFLDVFNGFAYGSMGTTGGDVLVAEFAENLTEFVTFSHASIRSEGLVILMKC